jgi:hypothetical protein
MQDKFRRGRARGISGAPQFLAPPHDPELQPWTSDSSRRAGRVGRGELGRSVLGLVIVAVPANDPWELRSWVRDDSRHAGPVGGSSQWVGDDSLSYAAR